MWFQGMSKTQPDPTEGVNETNKKSLYQPSQRPWYSGICWLLQLNFVLYWVLANGYPEHVNSQEPPFFQCPETSCRCYVSRKST